MASIISGHLARVGHLGDRSSRAAEMPELPEVEAQRRTIEEATVGKQITTLVAVEQGGGPRDGLFDDKVIGEGVALEVLESSLQKRWVIGVRRRGKQLWLARSPRRAAAPAPAACCFTSE